MTTIMSGLFDPLFADATVRDFASGDSLFRAGDLVVSMILLRDGRADLVRHTGHGLRMILHRANAGQILGEASAWSDIYHCDAVASSPCVAAFLPRQVFRKRLQAEPGFADRWAQNLAQTVQAARVRVEIRSLSKVSERLDAWLSEGHALPERGHWQDVAAELGVTREALYRELARRRKGAGQEPSPT
jgi:CRP-like cAMP-binding protein